MAMANCEPTEQADGSRVQKPLRSWTVAEAAEMASEAPMSADGLLCWLPPLGSSSSTTPSQNATRNRKNIDPVSPAADPAATASRLAVGIEGRVRGAGRFLPIIEQNMPQIFHELQRSRLTENLC